ncbi:MAG: NlpC/P60 family protein [Sphingobacteriales bacterium]|nr:MAG: NlpC/P60 family protein [Sphingobacteriales bacterium]
MFVDVSFSKLKTKVIMRKRSVLRQVIVLTIFFLSVGFSSAYATNPGKPDALKMDSAYRSDFSFLEEYSKKFGFNIDTFCNQTLITTVAEWIGTPYRHAGYSKAGIDCSGFVSKMYKDIFGIDLTHSSSAMIYQMKETVKKEDLKEGDILFFRIHGKRISHVGMYLGENKFVHASITRGIVVDDLREAYYAKAYYTAGRPALPDMVEETLNAFSE